MWIAFACMTFDVAPWLILVLRPVNETSLQSNAVSHWLGTNLESALSTLLIYSVAETIQYCRCKFEWLIQLSRGWEASVTDKPSLVIAEEQDTYYRMVSDVELSLSPVEKMWFMVNFRVKALANIKTVFVYTMFLAH